MDTSIQTGGHSWTHQRLSLCLLESDRQFMLSCTSVRCTGRPFIPLITQSFHLRRGGSGSGFYCRSQISVYGLLLQCAILCMSSYIATTIQSALMRLFSISFSSYTQFCLYVYILHWHVFPSDSLASLARTIKMYWRLSRKPGLKWFHPPKK